ncbi:hypothetical protein [uncultured Limnobacter sp.]|uniref:hypothetical protein n=1 Tax=uncultured Limnobacter sp. TaxID=199681 RepID=UPI0030F52131
MIDQTPVAKIQTPNATPTVTRNGQAVADAELFQWGDEISNTSATPMEIRIPARGAGQGDTLLVLQPGAAARLEEIGSDVAGAASRTKVVALTEGVELYDIDDDISSAILEQGTGEMSGLVGAGLLAGGLGSGAAAGLGAVAAGAFILGNDDDNGGAGDGGSGAGGLAGGVESVGDGLEETPLAPVAGATDAVSDGLGTVGGAIGGISDQDPTGLTDVLAGVVGDPGSGDGSDAGGVVGAVNAISTGLDSGTENTPLAPVVDPLTETLGSDSGAVDGVAEGLADVGNTLAGDDSPLAPITSDILAPIVGTSDDTSDTNGLPGTLNEVSEGLTDLTAEDAALAPLDPVTSAVGDGVDTLAGGVETLGNAVTDASAQDPTGLIGTVGEVLGGDTASSSDSSAGTDALPLDMLTGALPISTDGGGLGALDPVTGALPI